MSLTLQKLEHSYMGGKPAFWLILLAILCFGLQQANALSPTQVSITNRSGLNFIFDHNNAANGPRAAYVAYEIRNTSNLVLTGLTASLGGFASGFSLAGGQTAIQTIGTLNPNTSVWVFWYVSYPHTSTSASTNLVVTLSDSNPGIVSNSLTYRTRSSVSNSAAGQLVSMTMAGGLVFGDDVLVDVTYDLGNANISSGVFVFFQPAGNLDFNAACFQLIKTEVISSTISAVVPVGSTNTLSFNVNSATGGGAKQVVVRYRFKASCLGSSTLLKPYYCEGRVINTNNNGLRHTNNYGVVSLNLPALAPDPCSVGNPDDFGVLQNNIGINVEGDNWSAAWGDYDNDGYPDLFVTTNDPKQPNALYRYVGSGQYERVNFAPFSEDTASSLSSTWGDYDNDGDLDLYVANNIGYENFLYRNEGGGNFTKILNDPIVTDMGYSHGASWVDYDNDGFLDMFVTTYWETAFNLLYHNNGDGTFSKVINNAIVNEASRSVSGVWGDYDNDGLQDLFVANTGGRNNSLYRNLGGGQFEKITTGNIVNDGGSSVGASWGDYNNDGNLDLFVSNAGNEPCFLYQNNGDGSFTKITSGAIVTDRGDAHGSAWADWDNDGDLDLFVARDGRDNSLYRNDGGGDFTALSNEMTNDGGLSFGCAWADYDRDGDLDLVVANRKGTGNFFYRNDRGACKNWVSVKLAGTISNKSAIGARVSLTATINGKTVTQTREVTAQSGGGIGGQNEMVLNFGLGNATVVNLIVVEWPSGYSQSLANQPINRRLNITEDNAGEVSGRVYWEENINCNGGLPTPPLASQTATYRTAQAGNWSSSSTWVGGNIPPFVSINNLSISIEHDVTIPNGNIFITGSNTRIWVTNAKLTLVNGNLTMERGMLSLLGANFEMRNGNFDITNVNARFVVVKSSVSVTGNHYSVGRKRWEDACFQLTGSYNNGGTDTLQNVKMQVGGNFQNYIAGVMVINEAKIHVTNGGFQNIAPAVCKGSGLTVWLDNGNIQNWSNWTTTIAQYCTPSWANPVGVAGYLPPSKDCATIAAQFVDDPCTVVPNTANRKGIPFAKVVFQPGNVTVFADENGYYSAYLPTGSYTAQEYPGDNYKPACPNSAGTRSVVITGPGQQLRNMDFGNEPREIAPDLLTQIVIAAHRIGGNNLLLVNYKNMGTAASENTILEVTLPSELEIQHTSLPSLQAKSQTLAFDLGTLNTNAGGVLYISYTIGLATPVGLDLEVASVISGKFDDIDITNNASSDRSFTVASFDPNDIAVSPARFFKKEEWLKYKIRFQNVGNIPASQIRVEDELPAGLDVSTLEMGTVSHNYKLQIEGRKLVWIFPNINLADSLSNEPESHGFITFRIKAQEGMSIGDRLKNRAAIYFDNLEPVITNTVENVLTEEILKETRAAAKPLQLFPNPSGGKLVVQSYDLDLEPETFFVEISVFDHFGKQVFGTTNIADQRPEFYLHFLTNGHYMVKALDSKGKSYFGKLVLMKN
jgi:uncharacterized repeat protein (TIGR01451 family)